jgi:hypothetical protein
LKKKKAMSDDDENDPWSENPFAPENSDNADEEDFMPQNMSSYSKRMSKKTVSKKKPTWTQQVKEFFSEEPVVKKRGSKKNPSKKKTTKVSKKKASKKKTSVRKSSKKLSSYTKSKTSKDFYKHHPAQRK